MRRRQRTQWLARMIVFALLLVAGCQQRVDSPLVGRWQVIGADELAERMTGDTAEDRVEKMRTKDQVEPVDNFIGGKMEIEFTADNKFYSRTTIMNSLNEKSGTWSLKHTENDSITITTTINGESVETEIKMLAENRLSMIPPNIDVLNEAFRFKRVK